MSQLLDQIWRNAYAELGTTEIAGQDHEKKILEYHAVTTLKATTDEVPWCSSFACWVVEKSGLKSTKSAAAKSWLTWGVRLETPVRGCVVVTTRKGGHHVGFFDRLSPSGTNVWLLGGNQKNSVCIVPFSVQRVLEFRGPA